jgi:hypothetical protein
MESKMSENDDPFREEDVKKPEKEKDLPESFDADKSSDEDDDVIDLLNFSEEPDDEEIFELKETVDEMSVPDEDDDVIELTPETGPDNEDEDIVELAEEADIDTGEDEDIVELAEETTIDAGSDEDIVELAEEATIDAGSDEDIVELAGETTEPAAIEVDEDKQILELIDDIQSTLDETKETETVDSADDTDQTPLTEDTGEAIDSEESFEESILLGDDETVETDELSDSESEFVDHLGLDLTAEFSKELLSENSKASVLLTEKIEEAVTRVIQNMLYDENSSLVQAIKKAAKKEIE